LTVSVTWREPKADLISLQVKVTYSDLNIQDYYLSQRQVPALKGFRLWKEWVAKRQEAIFSVAE